MVKTLSFTEMSFEFGLFDWAAYHESNSSQSLEEQKASNLNLKTESLFGVSINSPIKQLNDPVCNFQPINEFALLFLFMFV